MSVGRWLYSKLFVVHLSTERSNFLEGNSMNTIMKGDRENDTTTVSRQKSFVMLSEGDQKLNTIKQNVFFFQECVL